MPKTTGRPWPRLTNVCSATDLFVSFSQSPWQRRDRGRLCREVVGYLVDEVDDPVYERTRNYGADHQLQTLDEGRRRLPVTLSEDLRVTLTFVPQIWRDDQAIEDDVSEPTDRTVSRSLLLERFPTEADWYAKAEIRDDLRYEGDAPQWIRDWARPL